MSAKDECVEEFDQIFLANYDALSRLLYRVVGDTGWAEELAAEAFWKLHRKPPASCNNIAGWLYRTGLNLALDNLKKRKRRAHYESLTPVVASVPTPEQTASHAEQRIRVRTVLAALKTKQASLLVLRSEGYSLAEIASFLCLAPNSVGTLLARADMAFRKDYTKRYGGR